VSVEPRDFMILLARIDKPLVVVAESRILRVTYQYLVGYKGLVFFAKSGNPLQLPGSAEVIAAKKIWIPA
jgi:hypothetical protein